MPPFPYFEILKKAYDLSRRHAWLWIFGLFIGGTSGINFGSFRYLFFPPATRVDFLYLSGQWQNFLNWVRGNPEMFYLLGGAVVVASVALIVASGLSKGAVIWSVGQFLDPEEQEKKPINFKKALLTSRKYVWKIVGVQAIVVLSFFALFFVFAAPVVYLLSVGAAGRAIVLSLLGLVIFIPAAMVLAFTHLYGPIFIVLFERQVKEAIQISFNLLRHKLRESIILAAFLLGLSLLFLFVVAFSLIVFSLPIGLLALLLYKLGLFFALETLLVGTVITGVCYAIVLTAGFSVFQNVTWILAVEHLVRTRKLEKQERVYVPEPAA